MASPLKSKRQRKMPFYVPWMTLSYTEKNFFRVNFSYAVEHGLLTDYKVLVLTVNENDLPENVLTDIKSPEKKELNFDDTSKLIGVINGPLQNNPR